MPLIESANDVVKMTTPYGSRSRLVFMILPALSESGERSIKLSSMIRIDLTITSQNISGVLPSGCWVVLEGVLVFMVTESVKKQATIMSMFIN